MRERLLARNGPGYQLAQAAGFTLSVGQQQVVEIAKAMSFKPSILLLDEPTSALATREVKQLFALVDGCGHAV